VAVAAAVLMPVRAGAQSAALQGQVHLVDAVPGGAVVVLLPLEAIPGAPQTDTVLIDQHELRFLPGVAALRPGSVIQFRNSDPVLHNVFSPRGPGPGFNLGTYPRPEVRSQVLRAEGVHVILCHVHPEMVAYLVVAPTGHRAVTDDAGRFALDDLPPGRYRTQVWWRRRLRVDTVLTLEPAEFRVVELGNGHARGGKTP
jgi:plastocyanin